MTENKKKVYIIKQNNDEDDIRSKNECFEDPEKFLTQYPKMIIGNTPFIDVNSKKHFFNEIQHTFQGKLNNYYSNKGYLSTFSTNYNNNKNKKDEDNKSNIHIEENDDLSKIVKINKKTRNSVLFKKKQNENILSDKPLDEKEIQKILDERKSRETRKTTRINKNKRKTCFNLYEKPKIAGIGIHYEYKSKDEICSLFSDYKEKEKESKNNGIDTYLPKKLDKEIKREFNKQERQINLIKQTRARSAKISKYLSSRLNKKEENLLYNKIEEYRMKRQMIDLAESNKLLQEKFGDNYWLFNLRRPDNLVDKRVDYYFNNCNSGKDAIWYQYIDYPVNPVEIIIDPCSKTKDNFIKKNIKDNNNKDQTNKNCNFPNVKNINELKIQCNNLINQEKNYFLSYKNINKKNIQFKVYKDPKVEKTKNINDFVYKENYSNRKSNSTSKKYFKNVLK